MGDDQGYNLTATILGIAIKKKKKPDRSKKLSKKKHMFVVEVFFYNLFGYELVVNDASLVLTENNHDIKT